MHCFRVLAALFALLVSFAHADQGAEQNVNPGINDNYRNPNFSQWQGIFEQDGREIFARRHDILRELNLRPGMAVADVGAGTGFFSLMMAEQVGDEGKVHAVDIAQNFLDAIDQRARAAGLNNVQTLLAGQNSVNLTPNSVDLVYIADTYHHFEYPVTYMKTIVQALKPGGQVVVVDFKRIPGFTSAWVMGHVRAGKQVFIDEMRQAGLVLAEERDFMRSQYFLRMVRVDDSD